MDFLIMIVAAVIFFGKLAAKNEGEGRKKRTQNVGPTAEDERRAKWQGKRKPALDEDPDIQGSMHAASEEPTEEA